MTLAKALVEFAAQETAEAAIAVCKAAQRERFSLDISDNARVAIEMFDCDRPKDDAEVIRFARTIRRLLKVS